MAGPETLRFGQVGELRVRLRSPLQAGIGELQQALTWTSDGAWQLFEQISYKGTVGEDHLERNPGVPVQFAASYASLIAQLNEAQALSLFVADLDPTLDPDCGVGASRVTLMIRDSSRDEQMEWTRCGFGTLAALETGGAGPDPQAGRVIQAAILARRFTLGDDFESTYAGSLPFATVEKGDESGSTLAEPQVFRAPDAQADPTEPSAWNTFWAAHTGGSRPKPEVDWATEMVLVGAVGVREEAGDSVEIRRVLPIDTGTRIEIFERIPGDFCAPANRLVRPYHVVLAPRTPAPVFFTDVLPERVACGTP